MFTKNDRFLKTARVLADVSFVLGLIVSFTLGIVLHGRVEKCTILIDFAGRSIFLLDSVDICQTMAVPMLRCQIHSQ